MVVGGWIVSEYRNMFDVVAMIPGVRRKPARLCCGEGTLQPCDLMTMFCWVESSFGVGENNSTGLSWKPQPHPILQGGVQKTGLTSKLAWLELF